jgi:UrcA family protein
MTMRMMMAALVVAALASPALAAQPGYEESRVTVKTADIDLATASGQKLLGKRLDIAMSRLCGTPIMFTRDEIAALDACRSDALAAAAPQIEAARARQAVMVAARR